MVTALRFKKCGSNSFVDKSREVLVKYNVVLELIPALYSEEPAVVEEASHLIEQLTGHSKNF